MDLCCLVSCHSCQLFHVSDFVVHALLFVGCILSLASESSIIVIILGFCMRDFFKFHDWNLALLAVSNLVFN